MRLAVIHLPGVSVRVVSAESSESSADEAKKEECPIKETAAGTECDTGPGPIMPELKELYWGGGAFLVFAILMRVVLYPKLKKGMTARYEGIRSAHESADAERASARAEVADYEQQLAGIKAEAARKLEAARATVESERSTAIAQLNSRLSEQRASATAQAEAARSAAASQIRDAVADVAGRAGELATGKRPSADVVSRVVQEVMSK